MTEQASEPRRAPPTLVSVVIAALNEEEFLGEQLEALTAQTYTGEWEIVLADNGSTDNTRAVAQQWAERLPSFRIVDVSAKRGIGYEKNAGAAHSKGDLVVYCDADDAVAPRWLEEMVAAAPKGDLIAGRQNVELLNDRERWPWQPTSRQWIPGGGRPFLPAATGANFGIWRDVLQAIGGWDETYLFCGDDVEICWRAQIMSYKLVVTEKAIINYRYRRSFRAFAVQRFRYAKVHPRLYTHFRQHGMKRPSFKVAFRRWGSLIYRLPQALVSRRWRAEWVYRAVVASGHLVGSIKWRVLYL